MKARTYGNFLWMLNIFFYLLPTLILFLFYKTNAIQSVVVNFNDLLISYQPIILILYSVITMISIFYSISFHREAKLFLENGEGKNEIRELGFDLKVKLTKLIKLFSLSTGPILLSVLSGMEIYYIIILLVPGFIFHFSWKSYSPIMLVPRS